MNLDFGLQQNKLKTIGDWMERLGFVVFVFTFWIPGGFFLGGDPTFLGPFLPTLEIVFPWCGIGIFLLFFGRFLNQTNGRLSQSQILFMLLFLGFFAIDAAFSTNPQASVLFLLVWAVAFLTSTMGETFFIKGALKRSLWALSMLIGFLFASFLPHVGISSEILGIGAVLGLVFLFHENYFWGRSLLLLIYLWIIFEMGIFLLFLLALFLLLTVKVWTPSFRRNIQKHEIGGGVVFIILLIIWGMWSGKFDLSFVWGWISGWGGSVWNVLFGVGEGQYFVALQQFSQTYLIPKELVLPSSGYMFSLMEKGILGLGFVLSFLIVPTYLQEKKKYIFPILFLIFFLFTTDLVSTENGILLLGAITFAHLPLMRFSNQV